MTAEEVDALDAFVDYTATREQAHAEITADLPEYACHQQPQAGTMLTDRLLVDGTLASMPFMIVPVPRWRQRHPRPLAAPADPV